MNALEISHFTKRYDDFVAVNDISLEIKPGEFFGFLGPNGAGKTSTISCTTGIASFTEGDIRVFGVSVRENYREARKKIGLSPQEFNVDIFAKTEKILWYNGGFYGMPKQDREKRIEEMLDVFELQEHRKKKFQMLSGGLKRRVMLARAMMHDPELIILDEPTAGVDVELRHELWKYLKRINEEGKTILLTSHYLEEVELLCDRIAIINKGSIIADKPKKEYVENGKTLEEVYLQLTKEDENNNT
jgi:ABC-2 type transport system ATP-binding protein